MCDSHTEMILQSSLRVTMAITIIAASLWNIPPVSNSNHCSFLHIQLMSISLSLLLILMALPLSSHLYSTDFYYGISNSSIWFHLDCELSVSMSEHIIQRRVNDVLSTFKMPGKDSKYFLLLIPVYFFPGILAIDDG